MIVAKIYPMTFVVASLEPLLPELQARSSRSRYRGYTKHSKELTSIHLAPRLILLYSLAFLTGADSLSRHPQIRTHNYKKQNHVDAGIRLYPGILGTSR